MRISLLLLLIFSQPLLAEMSMEEKMKLLKAKLFAKTPKKSSEAKSIYLPLKVNGILQDEVFVKIDNQEHVQVGKETVEYVRSLLKKSHQKAFNPTLNKANFTALKNLEILGIKTSYNSEKILLKITIPAELKKASTIRFVQKRSRDINGSTLPEAYSGGINLYMNQQYNQQGTEGFQKNALNLSSDIFLNIHDVVLEGQLQYSQEKQKLTRGAFKVVKDDGENLLRYQLGDISLPSHKRLSYQSALGFSMEKNFNLGSSYNQNSTRINSHEFFIQNRSRVEIYVNNRYRNSLNLLGGTHNLFDLNLPSGLNHVQLKVIEEGGKIEYMEFNDFSYSEVLKKGLVRYGGGVGIASDERENGWNYLKDERLASAYIEYGAFDDITIEGGFQKSNQELSGDLELLIGTNFGLFNPYLVGTKSDDEWSYKRGLEYKSNIGELNMNLLYEESDLNQQKSQLYRGNFYYQLGMGVNMGLSLSSYQQEEDKEQSQSLVLRKSFGGVSTELSLENLEKQGKKEDKIYLTLDYQFGAYSTRYANYIGDHKEQLDFKYHAPKRYGLNSELLLEKSAKRDNYSLRADINNEKFRINSNYNFSKGSTSKSQNFGLQLATGIVFAGEHATVTSPITSSFIIVDSDNRLETPLGIQNYQEADEFLYDSFAMEISDYEEREFVVEESNLDFGVDLEKFQEKFISNYKSGSVMEINVQNFYSVKGLFYDEDSQKPLAGKAFKIFNLQTGEKSTSFTNDQGEFTINHVGVGKYNITFVKSAQEHTASRYSFTIGKEEEESLMDMGKIYIKSPQKEEVKKLLVYEKKSNQSIGKNLKQQLHEIHFKKDAYQLTQEDKKRLTLLVKALKKEPILKLDIVGYPDSNGYKKVEMDIAYQRATAVRDFLQQKGIPAKQLNTLGKQTKSDAPKSELSKVKFQVR